MLSSIKSNFLSSFSLCFAPLLVFAFFSVEANESFGQSDQLELAEKYKIVEVDPDAESKRALMDRNRAARSARRNAVKLVQEAMASGNSLETPEIKGVFSGYVFPMMTAKSQLAKAGELRDDFDRTYLSSRFSNAARANFIESVAVPGLKGIIDNKDLSPAARVNAIVLMGQLDEAPLNRSAKTPPRPSLDAFDVMLNILTDANSEPFLQAPAMSGVLRHVQIDRAAANGRIPQPQLTSLVQYVTTMFDSTLKEDPELKDGFNEWKVGEGLRLMGMIRSPADAPVFLDRIVSVLEADSKVPTWVKLKAVRAMGELSMAGIDPAKMNAAVEAAVGYANSALETEAKLIKASVDELIYDNILYDDVDLEVTGTNYNAKPSGTGMGMGGGMGMGLGGGMGMGDDEGDLGGGMGMGGGPGMGGMGMGGGRGGGMGMGGGPGMGMGGNRSFEKPDPVVDLPNYELNLIRRKIKLIVFSVKQLIARDAIKNAVSDKHKTAISSLDALFGDFMTDSSVGIKDLDEEEEVAFPGGELVQKKSVASQLIEVCKDYSEKIANQIAAMRGEAVPERAAKPADDSAPVGSPFK